MWNIEIDGSAKESINCIQAFSLFFSVSNECLLGKKKREREREKLTLHLVDFAVGDTKFVNIMSFFLILV